MAEKQKCMIIGASPIPGKKIFLEYPPADYFIICADGGYETAVTFDIQPDFVVGDFDSASQMPPKTMKCLSLPVEKDVTDTMFAVMKGLTKGFRDFVLLGCLGGQRFDHSIANLEVLQFLTDHGAKGVLADEHTKVFVIRDSRLRLSQMKGTTVSVFPYNGATCNVSYDGLEYPLNHETLTCGGTLMGVSNRVNADLAEIRVHTGTALVTLYEP